VALAGALVADPPLLLLDEPSAALDPPGKNQLANLLQGQSAAMLVATHDLDFARRFCTRFLMLDEGGVAFDGTDASQIAQRWESGDGTTLP
jgi:cobalt/nickel transport system ATP-binding protein